MVIYSINQFSISYRKELCIRALSDSYLSPGGGLAVIMIGLFLFLFVVVVVVVVSSLTRTVLESLVVGPPFAPFESNSS